MNPPAARRSRPGRLEAAVLPGASPGRAGYRFDLADVQFLVSTGGSDALCSAESLPLTDETLLTDLTRLRALVGSHAAAVAETIRLRRRAVRKVGERAKLWLFTDEALQQATPALVARHRARRLTGIGVHDLTCSIGADLAELGECCPVAIGSDLDPVRVAMGGHNLRAAGGRARLLVADALTRTTRGLLPYADPARRQSAGRRITSEFTIPPIADLDRIHSGRPPVLRVPPGIDYERMARPGEVEVVSLDGSVREAVLWPPELARVARRATVLISDPAGGEGSAGDASGSAPGAHSGPSGYQLTSDDPDDAPVGEGIVGGHIVGQWMVDPDPAVVRAHLVRHYAARHGLALLDPQLAYLTGPDRPPGIRAFRVLDAAAFTERTVAGWVRRDQCGALEILQRGTPVVPDDLRKRLRPAMGPDTSIDYTLILARIGSGAGSGEMAYWCRAVAGPAGEAAAAH